MDFYVAHYQRSGDGGKKSEMFPHIIFESPQGASGIPSIRLHTVSTFPINVGVAFVSCKHPKSRVDGSQMEVKSILDY